MKNALLISFFESTNIGDKLISKQLRNVFSKYYNISICDFTGIHSIDRRRNIIKQSFFQRLKVEIKKTKLGSLLQYMYILLKLSMSVRWIKVKKYISDTDVVIIGGGNMIMDLEKVPNLTYIFYKYVKYAKKNNKKVYVVSVGVGPFRTKLQRKIAQKALNSCDYIAVRDNKSLDICKDIGVRREIFVSGDPVFLHPKIVHGEKSLEIAVSIYYYEKLAYYGTRYDDYINDFSNFIDKLVLGIDGYSVNLFSTEITDYAAVSDVYNKLKDKTRVSVVKISNEDELFKFYSKQKLVIGTRMHSLIIAMTQNIPVVGLSWQPKVKALFDLIQSNESVFELVDIKKKPNDIISLCNRKLNEYYEEVSKIESSVIKIRDNVYESFQDII